MKDLGPFKQILEDVVRRGAIAIFLAPKKKNKKIINSDNEEED